jgi:hypothetical protein
MDDQAAMNGLREMLNITQYDPPDAEDMKRALKGYDGPADFKTMYWWAKGRMSVEKPVDEFKQMLRTIKRKRYAQD